MDIINPQVPLIPKQQLDLNLAEEVLIAGLSDLDVLKTEEAHLLLKRLKETMKGLVSYNVPKSIRADLPRRKEDLNEFLGRIPTISRRDILRIIALYDWVSKIDLILDNIKTKQPDLKERVLSLIKQISASKKNTSVTDIKVEKLNLRTKDDIWKSDAYIDIYSGSITNKITTREITNAEKIITFSRPIYSQNIYSNYTENNSVNTTVGNKIYDTLESALDCTIDINSPVLFGSIEIELGAPFEIISIETLGNTGNFETITEQIIGRNILINGEEVISTTQESIIDNFAVSRYTLVLPNSLNRLRVNIRFSGFDSYSVRLYELINSRNEIVRTYTLRESMIIDARLAGSGVAKEREELLESTSLGQLREVNSPSPLRIIDFKSIRVNEITTSVASKTITKYIVSDVKIKKVEFYVDSYDPLQLVRFKVLSGKDTVNPISPINSNPSDPTVVNFSGALPTEIQIQIDIPVVPTYRPIIHGIAVLLGEVNI